MHHAFLSDVLDRLRDLVATETRCRATVRVAWALDGAARDDAPPAIEEFEREWGDWRAPAFLERVAIPSVRQSGDDLGERLWFGLQAAAQQTDIVVAVGSDHPELSVEQVGRAVAVCAASEKRAVFVPADDGGFVLLALGAASVSRGLFEQIDWSTPAVMRQCRQRAEALGLEVVELDVAHDCDDPEALHALAGRLTEAPGTCRHTEAFLDEMGFLEGAS